MKMRSVSLSSIATTAAFAAALIATARHSQAQNLTWTGGNSTGVISWGAANNFNAPLTASTVNLTFTTANSSITPIVSSAIGFGRLINSMTFGPDVDGPIGISYTGNATSTSYTLTMGNATLTSPSINVASGATGDITLGNPFSIAGASLSSTANLTLGGNLTVDHQGSGILLFNRPIGNSTFGLTKTGNGTMQTNNNNLATGTLTLSAGTFIANTFGQSLDIGNFSLVNLNGGTLQVNHNSDNTNESSATYTSKAYSNSFSVTAPSLIAFYNSRNATETLNITGNTTLDLGAALTMRNISSNQTLGNTMTVSRAITGASNLVVETYNNIQGLADNMALGRVTLSGNNTAWLGDLVIRQGTAGFGGNVTNSSAGGGKIILGETGNAFGSGLHLVSFGFTGIPFTINKNIVVRSGGFRTIRLFSDNTYNVNGTITLENDLTLTNQGFFNTYNLIINGGISGNGSLNITETGTTVGSAFTRLTGNNSYTGSTNIGANATLSVFSESGNAIPDTSVVSLDSGSALTVSSNETIASLASSASNSNVFVGSGVTLTTGVDNQSTTFGGVITGSGNVSKMGAGTMTLNGANTSSGAFNVNAGTLKLGSNTALGFGDFLSAAPAVTTVAGGATLDLAGSSINEPVVLSGSGAGGVGALINSSVTAASIGNGVAGLTITSGGSGYSFVPAVTISGTGTGATATATLGLSAASFTAFSGGDKVYTVAPVVTISGGGGSGATAVAVLSDGATGTLTGFTITNPGTGYTSAPTITFGSGTFTSGSVNGSATGNGSSFIVSAISVTNAGSGYTGTPTYTIDSGNATPGAVVLSSVVLAGDTSIGGSGDISINAAVSESGGARFLTKLGSGTLALAAPAYSGNTTVTSGKLSLGAPNASNNSSTVSIASGAVLELNFVGSDTVDKLFLAGVQQSAGTYTSAHSSGAFQGSGSLVVTSSPVSADTTPPVITLNGSASVSVNWGATYSDAGATATDNVDTVVTVSTSGSVNTAKPGVYTLTYNAADVANNAATPVTRTVTVTIPNAATVGADGLSPLMKYAFGANGPSDTVQVPVTSATATELKLTAVVRTNDSNLTVSAETNTDLAVSGSWTGTGITEALAADQTNLPAGCVRKVYSVTITGAAKKFLRIKAVSTF